MTPEERQHLIDRYAGSVEALQIALIQIGSYGLDRSPEGEWTPRQIIHHLADAEVLRSARLRLILGGDNEHLPAFVEHEFAGRLDYSRPLDASIGVLQAAIEANLELLAGLPDGAWQRAGRLEDVGRFTLEDWLNRASTHCYEHVSQLQSYVGA
jgi:DinB family protein